MSDTVIRVENLSKSYTISHQSGERYTALRDVRANGVKRMQKTVICAGDEFGYHQASGFGVVDHPERVGVD